MPNALPILLLGGAAALMLAGKKKGVTNGKNTVVYRGKEVPAYIKDNEDDGNEMADIVVDVPLDSDVKLVTRRFGARRMTAAKGDLGGVKKAVARRPGPPARAAQYDGEEAQAA
jgi:hypothetical protein